MNDGSFVSKPNPNNGIETDKVKVQFHNIYLVWWIQTRLQWKEFWLMRTLHILNKIVKV